MFRAHWILPLLTLALGACGTKDDTGDADGDGYGRLDCDDADPEVYPGAPEQYYDDLDQDCDGLSDFDQDGDGQDYDMYGGQDCDDSTADVFWGAVETWYDGTDSNCDGADDYDADGDGSQVDSVGGGDCDDGDATVHPNATEAWYDGVDQDCDGRDDYDADGDGYTSQDWRGTDCDDTDALINPNAAEIWYDGVDQDCGDDSDFDADYDGFDSDDYGGADCDDASRFVSPDDAESCDGLDNDCDGVVDDGYTDTDRDGVADCLDSEVCDRLDNDGDGEVDEVPDDDGDGYSTCAGGPGGADCDDTDAAVNPGAYESLSDGVDNDCDGYVDEFGPSDGAMWIEWGYLYNYANPTLDSTYAGFSLSGRLSDEGESLVGDLTFTVYDKGKVAICSVVGDVNLTEDTSVVRALDPVVQLGWSGSLILASDSCSFHLPANHAFYLGIADSESAFADMEVDYGITAADNALAQLSMSSFYGYTTAGYFAYGSLSAMWDESELLPLGYWFYP